MQNPRMCQPITAIQVGPSSQLVIARCIQNLGLPVIMYILSHRSTIQAGIVIPSLQRQQQNNTINLPTRIQEVIRSLQGQIQKVIRHLQGQEVVILHQAGREAAANLILHHQVPAAVGLIHHRRVQVLVQAAVGHAHHRAVQEAENNKMFYHEKQLGSK